MRATWVHKQLLSVAAGNPHSLFGTVPPPPTAEEVLNANPTAAPQPTPVNKLASFGKFWQGMTSGQPEDASAAKPSPRPSSVSAAFTLASCRADSRNSCNCDMAHDVASDQALSCNMVSHSSECAKKKLPESSHAWSTLAAALAMHSMCSPMLRSICVAPAVLGRACQVAGNPLAFSYPTI